MVVEILIGASCRVLANTHRSVTRTAVTRLVDKYIDILECTTTICEKSVL